MANVKQANATSTAVTITLASLADAAARESAAIDNTTNLYEDYLVQLKFKVANTAPADPKRVYIYVGSSEDGTKWVSPATGADAAITLQTVPVPRLAEVVLTETQNISYVSNVFSIAALFGGRMPRKFNIIVLNDSGMAFTATGSDHELTQTGVYRTVT